MEVRISAKKKSGNVIGCSGKAILHNVLSRKYRLDK
jgi:hypothetical protein